MDSACPSDQPINQSTEFLIGQIHADVKTLLGKAHDTEKRLRTVEKRQWVVAGGAFVVGALTKGGSALAGLIH